MAASGNKKTPTDNNPFTGVARKACKLAPLLLDGFTLHPPNVCCEPADIERRERIIRESRNAKDTALDYKKAIKHIELDPKRDIIAATKDGKSVWLSAVGLETEDKVASGKLERIPPGKWLDKDTGDNAPITFVRRYLENLSERERDTLTCTSKVPGTELPLGLIHRDLYLLKRGRKRTAAKVDKEEEEEEIERDNVPSASAPPPDAPVAVASVSAAHTPVASSSGKHQPKKQAIAAAPVPLANENMVIDTPHEELHKTALKTYNDKESITILQFAEHNAVGLFKNDAAAKMRKANIESEIAKSVDGPERRTVTEWKKHFSLQRKDQSQVLICSMAIFNTTEKAQQRLDLVTGELKEALRQEQSSVHSSVQAHADELEEIRGKWHKCRDENVELKAQLGTIKTELEIAQELKNVDIHMNGVAQPHAAPTPSPKKKQQAAAAVCVNSISSAAASSLVTVPVAAAVTASPSKKESTDKVYADFFGDDE